MIVILYSYISSQYSLITCFLSQFNWITRSTCSGQLHKTHKRCLWYFIIKKKSWRGVRSRPWLWTWALDNFSKLRDLTMRNKINEISHRLCKEKCLKFNPLKLTSMIKSINIFIELNLIGTLCCRNISNTTIQRRI